MTHPSIELALEVLRQDILRDKEHKLLLSDTYDRGDEVLSYLQEVIDSKEALLSLGERHLTGEFILMETDDTIEEINNSEEDYKPTTAKDWGDIALFFKRYTEDIRIELLEELKEADINPSAKALLLESMERAHSEVTQEDLKGKSWRYIENGYE